MDNVKEKIKTEVPKNKNVYAYTKEDIIEMICVYEGEFVLFDFCLAKIFDYNLKRINENLRKNSERYSSNDIYKINQDIAKTIIESSMTYNGLPTTFEDIPTTFEVSFGKRYIPTIFTKEGVGFLASLLKKDTVKIYLPIILEAFKDVEENNHIIKKVPYNQANMNIYDKVYTVRGEQVMLDFDLAEIYGYDVKRLNEQVKRNIERFDSDFMFQLTEEEMIVLSRSQIATSIQVKGIKGGRTYSINAFTEQGVYMLATVLNSPLAIEQSKMIMRSFKKLRHYMIEHSQLVPMSVANQFISHNQRIDSLENKIECIDQRNNDIKQNLTKLMNLFKDEESPKGFTFFNNQLFEADIVFKDIFSKANHSIYIIDNYISIKTLSHLRCKKEGVEVIIFSDNLGRKDRLQKVEFDDFNKQYQHLKLKHNRISHDRYIIIDYKRDNEKIYHSGASIKDAGKKLCSIIEMNDISDFYPKIDMLLAQDTYEFK